MIKNRKRESCHSFLLLLFWVLAFLFFQPSNALSDEKCYEMLEQKFFLSGQPDTPDNKHPLCKVLFDNLNEFCDKPMVCELEIHSKYSDQLSLPKWTRLDIHKNLDKIEAMIKAPWEIAKYNKDRQEESWQRYYSDLKKGLDDGTATLHHAKFDLRNLGQPYDVLRVEFGKCTGKFIPESVSGVIFEQSREDIEYTADVLRKLLTPRTANALIQHIHNVFFFQGQTFSYHWFENELLVSRPLRESDGFFGDEGLCRFKYTKPIKED